MKKIILISSFLALRLYAATYYVATDGNDSNSGTNTSAPFATPQKAFSTMASGDTVYVRGGTYALSVQLKTAKAGTSANYCNLFAYPGEQPVFDFATTPVATKGLYISKDYWHVKGIEVENATDNGIFIGQGFAIVEGCVVHDCDNDGICLGSTSSSAHDSLVLNCDSYRNINLASGGQDGDGFVGKSGCGPNNVFENCRSWNNADDGWDFYDNQTNAVVLTNCWSFRNGVDLWNLGSAFMGNGNGFKLGGAGTKAAHVVKNCIAFENVHKGFDQNNAVGGLTLYNCTSYSNELDFSFPDVLTAGTNFLKNNVAYLYTAIGLTNIYGPDSVQMSNSWQGHTVTAADFASFDDSQMTAPRNADYSLPTTSFLHLAVGSHLIDAGVNVGLPFNGSAPDLGAYEFAAGQNATMLSGAQSVSGGFKFLVNGLTSHGSVIINASSDLVNWLPIFTNPPLTGSLQFTDSAAANIGQRFYRAQEQ